MDLQWQVILATSLVLFSGLFSGLTLGLLSLDATNLEVLKDSGDESDRKYARKIVPLRKNGNLLLCTLLLGNTLVNSFLSILMADMFNSFAGFFTSSALILIFGEIVPQAFCSRYSLAVGANTAFITTFFIYVLMPITYPISYVLDSLLGTEIGLLYSKSELKRLIEIHVAKHAYESSNDVNGKVNQSALLDAEDQDMITGVLDYKQKTVGDVMTHLDKVFMVEHSTRLSFEAILDIYKSGYTRIPVYEKTRDNVVGILYAKDLILVDPNDEVEVKTILAFHEKKVIKVLDNTNLNIVFRMFKTSFCHLLVAVHLDENADSWMQHVDKMNHTLQCPQRVVGIITLEDVLEELIKTEIVDESDKYIDNLQDQLATSTRRKGMQRYLELFSYRSNMGDSLGENEVQAICVFLTECSPDFNSFDRASPNLIDFVGKHSVVVELTKEFLDQHENGLCLYTKGAPSEHVMLILAGTVHVISGKEGFTTTLGPWSLLGANMLSATRSRSYITDFTAVTKSDYCRFLKMSRSKYYTLLDTRHEEQKQVMADQV